MKNLKTNEREVTKENFSIVFVAFYRVATSSSPQLYLLGADWIIRNR
jgi:hypothetical protein